MGVAVTPVRATGGSSDTVVVNKPGRDGATTERGSARTGRRRVGMRTGLRVGVVALWDRGCRHRRVGRRAGDEVRVDLVR